MSSTKGSSTRRVCAGVRVSEEFEERGGRKGRELDAYLILRIVFYSGVWGIILQVCLLCICRESCVLRRRGK
jgi:hypothetical protein